MSQTPIGRLANSDEPLTPRKLLELVGGWLGVSESVLPPLLFSLTYTLSASGLWSVIIASATAVLFLLLRLARRERISGAIVGISGVALAAFLALREGGQTLDYFVPGFFTNAAYGSVLLLSILIRRPLLGYLLGFLAGERSPAEVNPYQRMAYLLTWLWVSFFALRLVVQLPLYFASNLELLAASRALLGAPAYAGLLALTWLIISRTLKRSESN